MSARAFAVLFSTVLLAACAQTEGEVCQLDGDCEGGQICCKAAGMMAVIAARGVCLTEEACRIAQVDDAGPPPGDAGMERDAQIDASGPGVGQACADASMSCAPGLVCFRGVCLLPDGTEPDAGATPDSGTDAGAPADDAGGDDGGLDAATLDAALDGGP